MPDPRDNRRCKTLVGLVEFVEELDTQLTEGAITPQQAILRMSYEALRSVAYGPKANTQAQLREMASIALEFGFHVREKHQ